VINELNSTVTAFGYDPAAGTLSELQTLSTLPAGYTGQSFTAEIAIRPDGKFLYGSNRGHDSIAIFAVDPSTGKLTAAGHQTTLGKKPRSFAIDPTGAYLLAANQDSDQIAVFRIDAAGGGLTAVGAPVAVPRPVSVVFVRPSR
jgi:6-phosphogluconolactonase